MKKFLNINTVSIENFSLYLEEAFLIFFVKIFHPSVRQQEKVARKVCIDTGLSNIVIFKISENIGKLMENVVAVELKRRNSEFYYWKEYGKSEGKEVDFLIKENLEIKQLIQVTYASSKDEIEKRKIKSLIKASELLKCKDLLIITWDYEDEIKENNKTIKYIPLWKWLIKFGSARS